MKMLTQEEKMETLNTLQSEKFVQKAMNVFKSITPLQKARMKVINITSKNKNRSHLYIKILHNFFREEDAYFLEGENDIFFQFKDMRDFNETISILINEKVSFPLIFNNGRIIVRFLLAGSLQIFCYKTSDYKMVKSLLKMLDLNLNEYKNENLT
tara:strand:+ start:296 stop:760 length:465 start_codon:yes stop_codon:yes gene_type:complete